MPVRSPRSLRCERKRSSSQSASPTTPTNSMSKIANEHDDDYFSPKDEQDSSLRINHPSLIAQQWRHATATSPKARLSDRLSLQRFSMTPADRAKTMPESPASSSVLTSTPTRPPARRRSVRTRTSVSISPQHTPTRSRSGSYSSDVPRSPLRGSPSRPGSKVSHHLSQPLQDVIEDIYDGEGPPDEVVRALSRADSNMTTATTTNSSIDRYLFGSAAVGRRISATSNRGTKRSSEISEGSIAQRRSKVLRPPAALMIRSVSADDVKDLSPKTHQSFESTLKDLKSSGTTALTTSSPTSLRTPDLTYSSLDHSGAVSTVTRSEQIYTTSPVLGKSSPARMRNSDVADWLGDTPKRKTHAVLLNLRTHSIQRERKSVPVRSRRTCSLPTVRSRHRRSMAAPMTCLHRCTRKRSVTRARSRPNRQS